MNGITLPSRTDFWCFRDNEPEFDALLERVEKLQATLAKPEVLLQLKNERGEGQQNPGYQVQDGVATISVNGTLVPKSNWIGNIFGFVGWNQVREWYEGALNDRSVKGIVARIGSGGGSWVGNSACTDWLTQVRGLKPMTAYVEGLGCSAAMCLAMQFSDISASRDSEVGSLGTIIKHVSWKNESEVVTVLRSGKKKALGYVSGEELSPEAKQTLEDRMGKINEMFLANCSRGRPQNTVEFLKSLEGADFTATQALEKGLIDNVCSFDQAVERLQEKIRMEELLKALGATNEKEALEKLQARDQKIQDLESQAVSADSVAKVQAATVAKLNEVTGQPTFEQAVATVSAWKLAVEAVPAKDQKIQGLEKQNLDIRMSQVLEKNQAKITADIRTKIDEQKDLAVAAGKDPVAVVQSFLDAVQPTLDLGNYTPAGGAERGSQNLAGPTTLTEEQELYYKRHCANVMSREEYLAVFGKK